MKERLPKKTRREVTSGIRTITTTPRENQAQGLRRLLRRTGESKFEFNLRDRRYLISLLINFQAQFESREFIEFKKQTFFEQAFFERQRPRRQRQKVFGQAQVFYLSFFAQVVLL